jgi:hypothetical protein
MGETITVQSWGDLSDRTTVWVEIERPAGLLRIPLRELTYHDWIQVEIDDPLPNPPVIAGKGGTKQYDRDEPAYRRKVGEVYERWTYRRLLKALQVTVPGEDEAAQMQALGEMSAPLLTALMGVLQSMHMANKARVENRAGSFPPGDVADAEGDPAPRVDAEPVEDPVAA